MQIVEASTEDQLELGKIAIKAILQNQIAAWNKRDAGAYAENFAEEGTFTNILGAFAIGKKIFHDRHDKIFKGVYSQSTFDQKLVSLQFVSSGVAVVETLISVINFPKQGPFQLLHTDEEGRFHTYLLQVMVKKEKSWEIVAYHNVDVKAGVQLSKPE